MAMKTFEELRTGNSLALERAKKLYARHGAEYAEAVQERRKQRLLLEMDALRTRMFELLAEDYSIEALADTSDQHAAYANSATGRGWEEEGFVAVRDIPAMETLTRHQVQELVLQRLSDMRISRKGRFEELFCAPENRVAYLPEIRGGNARFPENPNDIPVGACLVSADAFGGIAQKLGIIAFDEGDSDLDRLAKLKAIIPRFKAIWANLGFLDNPNAHPKNHRVNVVENPHELEERMHGELFTSIGKPPADVVGSVIINRTTHEGGKQTALFFPSAYEARRSRLHADRGYRREQRTMPQIQARLSGLQGPIGHYRAETPPDEREKIVTTVDAVLAVAEKELRGSIGENKRAAHERVASSRGLQDATGRRNPPASAPKIRAAAENLKRRYRNIPPLSKYNREDEALLDGEISREMAMLDTFRSGLELFARQINISLPEAVRSGDGFVARFRQAVGYERRNSNVRRLPDEPPQQGVQRPEYLPHALSRIRLRPLRTYACRTLEKADGFGAAVRAKNPDDARSRLVEMEVILKIAAANDALETIRDRCVCAEDLEREKHELLDLVTALLEDMDTYKVYAEHRVEAYVAPFGELRTLLRQIRNGLRFYARKQMTPKICAQMFDRMKERLLDPYLKEDPEGKTRTLEQMVRALP